MDTIGVMCDKCMGDGEYINFNLKHTCDVCSGTGEVTVEVHLEPAPDGDGRKTTLEDAGFACSSDEEDEDVMQLQFPFFAMPVVSLPDGSS